MLTLSLLSAAARRSAFFSSAGSLSVIISFAPETSSVLATSVLLTFSSETFVIILFGGLNVTLPA